MVGLRKRFTAGEKEAYCRVAALCSRLRSKVVEATTASLRDFLLCDFRPKPNVAPPAPRRLQARARPTQRRARPTPLHFTHTSTYTGGLLLGRD